MLVISAAALTGTLVTLAGTVPVGATAVKAPKPDATANWVAQHCSSLMAPSVLDKYFPGLIGQPPESQECDAIAKLPNMDWAAADIQVEPSSGQTVKIAANGALTQYDHLARATHDKTTVSGLGDAAFEALYPTGGCQTVTAYSGDVVVYGLATSMYPIPCVRLVQLTRYLFKTIEAGTNS